MWKNIQHLFYIHCIGFLQLLQAYNYARIPVCRAGYYNGLYKALKLIVVGTMSALWQQLPRLAFNILALTLVYRVSEGCVNSTVSETSRAHEFAGVWEEHTHTHTL